MFSNKYFDPVAGSRLYTEYLGEEMGIYRTPYERFGKLSYEMIEVPSAGGTRVAAPVKKLKLPRATIRPL